MTPGNVLKIESLSKYWCDKDTVMLHACFQLLKDCIEKEELLSGDNINWNATQKLRYVKKKLQELYDWWEDINYNNKTASHEEETDKLIELIKLRGYLWT